MTPSLDRLGELVRLAESRSRAKKLGAEAQQGAGQLRAAEQRARAASDRLREVRPARTKELEQADAAEQQLKELVKRLAQFKAALDPGADPESLIDASRAEIDQSRRAAREDLDAAAREADEAREALRAAMDHYTALRRELDRLQPQLAAEFSAEDRLLGDAEVLFPGGQLQALAREIEAGGPFFGALPRAEQYAQMKLWIGRYRQFQAAADPEPGEAAAALSQRAFHQLKNLSKQHEPGYIEAFRLDFHTDWAAYIAEAQDQFAQAAEAARRSRDQEHQRGEQHQRDQERQQQGRAALDQFRAWAAGGGTPEDAPAEFLAMLKQAVAGLGASDPDLLDAMDPFRESLNGGDSGLRALRRNLDRLRAEGPARRGEPDPLLAQFDDLRPATQGRRALMIGGSVREEVRKTLLKLFDFDRLDWEPYEDKPSVIEPLEQRVRNRGVDMVLLLKSFIAHSVSDRLRPLCQQHDVSCIMVEHGYGPAQVGEALRKGLTRTV